MGESPIDHDLCDFCPEVATVGESGVCDGKVSGTSYCDSCYNKAKVGETPERVNQYPELTEKGFKVKALNKGTQLVLKKDLVQVDFWPSSEKWISRADQSRGQGKQSLFEHFGV